MHPALNYKYFKLHVKLSNHTGNSDKLKVEGVLKRVKVPYFLISDTITSLLLLLRKQCRKTSIISHTHHRTWVHTTVLNSCKMSDVCPHCGDKDLSGLNETNKERHVTTCRRKHPYPKMKPPKLKTIQDQLPPCSASSCYVNGGRFCSGERRS